MMNESGLLTDKNSSSLNLNVNPNLIQDQKVKNVIWSLKNIMSVKIEMFVQQQAGTVQTSCWSCSNRMSTSALECFNPITNLFRSKVRIPR